MIVSVAEVYCKLAIGCILLAHSPNLSNTFCGR